MARSSRRPEELRERGEAGAGRPAGEQPSREPDRVDDGPGQPRPGETLRLAVEKGEIEAGVVRDEDAISGELEKATDADARMSLPAQLGVAETCQSTDRRPERYPRIHEQLGWAPRVSLEDGLSAQWEWASARVAPL